MDKIRDRKNQPSKETVHPETPEVLLWELVQVPTVEDAGDETPGGRHGPPEGATEEEIATADRLAGKLGGGLLADPRNPELLERAAALGEEVQAEAERRLRALRLTLGRAEDRMQKPGRRSVPMGLEDLEETLRAADPLPARERLDSRNRKGLLAGLRRRKPEVAKALAEITGKLEPVRDYLKKTAACFDDACDGLLNEAIELREHCRKLKPVGHRLGLERYSLERIVARFQGTGETEDSVPPELPANPARALALMMPRLYSLRRTDNALAGLIPMLSGTGGGLDGYVEALRTLTMLLSSFIEKAEEIRVPDDTEEGDLAAALEEARRYSEYLPADRLPASGMNFPYVAGSNGQLLIVADDLFALYVQLAGVLDSARKLEEQVVEASRQSIVQVEQILSDLAVRPRRL